MNSDADVQKALETVLLYAVDSEKGEGKDLAKEFKVGAYPTFVLAGKSGEPIDRWMGYAKDYFIKTMSSATADLAPIEQKQARYASQPDAHTAEVLGRYHAALENYKDAVAYYKQAQSLKADASTDFTFSIFENMAEGADGGLFSYEEISQAADAALANAKSEPLGIIDISSRMARISNKNERANDVARYMQAGLDATVGSDDPKLQQSHASLMVDFSLMVKKDTATAVEYKKATLPKGWLNDADQLNNFAWWCFETGANLDEAERLARKSVELAKPGHDKANSFDTLAEILHARGNTLEAVAISKEATREDPSSNYFKKQVERFEKLLADGHKG